LAIIYLFLPLGMKLEGVCISKLMQHAKYQYIQVSDIVANPVVADDVLGLNGVGVLVVRGGDALCIMIVVTGSDQSGDGVDIGSVDVRQRRDRSDGLMDELGYWIGRACIASDAE
jgi:hypothetical protein